MEKDKFWLVVDNRLISDTNYLFYDKEDAFAVASHMLKEESDKVFIMESIGFCKGVPAETVKFDDLHDKEECFWTADENDLNLWHTGCGKLTSYGLDQKDDKPEYCSFCGKKFVFIV